MSKMGEKVAYLKGLAEGMRLSAENDQSKLMLAVIDALETFAKESEATAAQLTELQEYVEEIDSDVSDLEEVLFSEDDEDEDEYDEYDDEEEYYELECPSCGEIVCFDGSLNPDNLVCPACGEKIADVQLCDGECEECDEKICENND